MNSIIIVIINNIWNRKQRKFDDEVKQEDKHLSLFLSYYTESESSEGRNQQGKQAKASQSTMQDEKKADMEAASAAATTPTTTTTTTPTAGGAFDPSSLPLPDESTAPPPINIEEPSLLPTIFEEAVMIRQQEQEQKEQQGKANATASTSTTTVEEDDGATDAAVAALHQQQPPSSASPLPPPPAKQAPKKNTAAAAVEEATKTLAVLASAAASPTTTKHASLQKKQQPAAAAAAATASPALAATSPPLKPLIQALRNIFHHLTRQEFESEVVLERLRRQSETTAIATGIIQNQNSYNNKKRAAADGTTNTNTGKERKKKKQKNNGTNDVVGAGGSGDGGTAAAAAPPPPFHHPMMTTMGGTAASFPPHPPMMMGPPYPYLPPFHPGMPMPNMGMMQQHPPFGQPPPPSPLFVQQPHQQGGPPRLLMRVYPPVQAPETAMSPKALAAAAKNVVEAAKAQAKKDEEDSKKKKQQANVGGAGTSTTTTTTTTATPVFAIAVPVPASLPKNSSNSTSSNAKKSSSASSLSPSPSSSKSPQQRNSHANWYLRFNELTRFKKKFRHLNVEHVANSVDDSYQPLLAWLKYQKNCWRRRVKGEINSLTNTQISAFVKLGVGSLEKGPALMERLPMELRKPKSRPVWVKHYASLCQFKEQCGHVTIPAKEPEYASLYLWTQKQLVEYRNYCNGVKSSLDENYLAKLKDVGLITEGQPVDSKFTPWSERFEELKAFKKEYGHCDVSLSTHKATHYKLAWWVDHQRKAFRQRLHKEKTGEKNKSWGTVMTQEQMEKLASIGFRFSLKHIEFEERIANIMQYKAANGHVRIPWSFKSYNGLGQWCGMVKKQYHDGKLRPERAAMLNNIEGWDWTVRGSKRGPGKKNYSSSANQMVI